MQRKTGNRKEKGQATMLVLVALSLFLLAGMGLTLDVSQLYSQRQLAQNAADASALAAMMSIFNATNTTNATFNNTFGNIVTAGQNPARLTCGSNDNHTPCYYARQNGFDPANGDTIFVDFWAQANAYTQEPGVSISTAGKDAVPLLRVTVIRPVPATLMRLVGGGTKNIAAQATAAIVTSVAPIPILIMHPTLNDAFIAKGTGTSPKIKICGGPKRSIQVNSCAGTGGSIAKPDGTGSASCKSGQAFNWTGNPIVDLSHAGPLDYGDCSTGTGADLGTFGLPTTVSSPTPVNFGTAGVYLEPASVIADPLINIAAPTTTGLTNQDTTGCTESATKSTCTDGQTPSHPVTCPATDFFGNAVTTCTVLYPGLYTSAGPLADIKSTFLIFTPGIYYIQSGGIQFDANSSAQTQTLPPATPGPYPTCSNADPRTGCGILIYLSANGGTLSVKANPQDIALLGSDPSLTYQKIAIFVDHAAPAQSHSFGGGATWSITGTIYMTNTVTTILNSTIPSAQGQYQSFSLGGNSGSGTLTGEIITDSLTLNGTPGIQMNLDPALNQIRQIALVR
jgi:Flp pilus assembly protein TadG